MNEAKLDLDCICVDNSTNIRPFCISCYGNNNFSNVIIFSCILLYFYRVDHAALFSLNIHGSNYFSNIRYVNDKPIHECENFPILSHSLFFHPYLFSSSVNLLQYERDALPYVKLDTTIESIVLGSYFANASFSFLVKDFKRLTSIQIGCESFVCDDPHQKFCVDSCDLLKSITIEKDSFPSFTSFSLSSS